ncbi:MAG: DoxX family protein [Phycisphaerales bacterium]|nr:DoxX family protein [Phycisphaerales bacterium]
MSTRDSFAVSVAPVFLRLVLGTTFIWAGLGKFMAEFSVKGEQAAALANMGVSSVQTRAGAAAAAESVKPVVKDPVKEAPKEAPKEPAKKTAKPGAQAPQTDPAVRLASFTLLPVQSSARTFTAADFPDEIKLARLYSVALLVHSAGKVPSDAKATFPLMPSQVTQGEWPVYIAWTVAISELLGGFLVLTGLFTRLSAFFLAGTMIGAIWLTEIGPAVQSGNAVFFFLPANRETFGMDWNTLLIQCSMLAMALNLMFAGAGGLSMDRAISGRPVVSKPKPAPQG